MGVVIPTFNRPDALMECLSCLEKQTFKDFEVVVIDDGSTDSTSRELEAYLAASPLAIRCVAQKNGGPAKARNLGISMLESSICLLIGDDIFASPTLLERHLAFHHEHPGRDFAALGLTRWSTTGQTITPFMKWLGESPAQFAYSDLNAGSKPDWRHFYTSNLSVKTQLLKEFPFNEAFPFAAMEDAELGYRISTQFGLNLAFVPDAVAFHLHPTTFRQACNRMLKVGYSDHLFHTLWPKERPLPSNRTKDRLKRAMASHSGLLKLLMISADLWTWFQCPNSVMSWTLYCFYQRGYESARNDDGNLVWRVGAHFS
jgi:glycosyltransferase involved in cell wall biosynthesis